MGDGAGKAAEGIKLQDLPAGLRQREGGTCQGGGAAGLCPALHLTGGQSAAGEDKGGNEDHGPQGRALLFPLEDAADAQLGLTGGAGQRGGEGGAGDRYHKSAS